MPLISRVRNIFRLAGVHKVPHNSVNSVIAIFYAVRAV